MADKDKYADEVISDDELDQVAGGTYNETAADTSFLNNLAGLCDRFGAPKLFFSKSANDDVKKAWESLGIKLSEHNVAPNRYYKDGQKISQKEAWAHAENLVCKHLTEKD